MTDPATLDTDALVAHILSRFHEAHRRDLPLLQARARAAVAGGAPSALAERLDAWPPHWSSTSSRRRCACSR
jgi:iron-sulfur cluster repair protein YtfE (RIC family)